jgi:uncharacterized membrane protein YdjX (TVP38/TMEM64 family)
MSLGIAIEYGIIVIYHRVKLKHLDNREFSPPKELNRKRAIKLVIALVLVWLCAWLVIWGAHDWDPLRSLVSVQGLTELSRPLAQHPVAPFIVAAAYFCSVWIVFPRALITMAAVLVFGPWFTFISGMTGLLLGAACGFWLGRKLTGERLTDLTRSPLLCRLEEKLHQGGALPVALVRLVPVAPFTIVNMILGVLQVRARDFLLGTVLGLLPGLVFSIFVAHGFRTMLHDPDRGSLLLLAAQLTGAAAALFILWRLARAKFKK